MDKFKNYDIAFSGLKNGKHEFDFEITQAFFDLFDTEKEFTDAKIAVHVLLEKHSTFLEFVITTNGTIGLECDITGEHFDHPFENSIQVLVKFGEKYDDSDENVITIPVQDYAFNVAQLIYEDVMLSVPMKKLSPNVSEKDLDLLNQFSPKTEEEETEENTSEDEIDPRWDALKNLKNK